MAVQLSVVVKKPDKSQVNVTSSTVDIKPSKQEKRRFEPNGWLRSRRASPGPDTLSASPALGGDGSAVGLPLQVTARQFPSFVKVPCDPSHVYVTEPSKPLLQANISVDSGAWPSASIAVPVGTEPVFNGASTTLPSHICPHSAGPLFTVRPLYPATQAHEYEISSELSAQILCGPQYVVSQTRVTVVGVDVSISHLSAVVKIPSLPQV
jgi:hypothetical protein